MSTLDPFYPIFDSYAWIERLVPLGIKLVQLRVKDQGEAVLRQEIDRAKSFCSAHHCQLIVNDYWQLAIDLECDYVHLGQEDLDDADLTAIRKNHIKLGISTHDHSELQRALALQPDYIALGPVYETILKKMPFAPQGVDRVREWKSLVGEIPLIAIGGLKLERAAAVFEAGANVVSLVTDITLNPDPETQVRKWLEVTAQFREQTAALPIS
ncbi:MAG: thiamine phosphate synthase [Pseudomonadota bacterium]